MQLIFDAAVREHRDGNIGPSISLAAGSFEGGCLNIQGDMFDIRRRPLQYDGNQLHWVEPHSGRRTSVTFFSHPRAFELDSKLVKHLEHQGFNFPGREFFRLDHPSTLPAFVDAKPLHPHPRKDVCCAYSAIIEIDTSLASAVFASKLMGFDLPHALQPRSEDERKMVSAHFLGAIVPSDMCGRRQLSELVVDAKALRRPFIIVVAVGPLSLSWMLALGRLQTCSS